MKIRLVTPWYGEFAGGAEFAARKLAENLRGRDMDAGVLTTCCKTPFDDWWTDHYAPGDYVVNGVPVTRFPVNGSSSDLYHLTNYKLIKGLPISRKDELNYMRGTINSHALISFLKKNRQNIYVFIPYLYGPTFWGVNAAPERSVMIPCLHDEAIARWGVIKETFSKAGKVVFLSEEERALAGRLYSIDTGSMPVTGMGLDTDISCDASRFREKYGIDGRFLLYSGRKDRGKNILVLIDYFKKYLESHGNGMKLIFTGGGDASLVPRGDPRFVDLSFIAEQDKYDAMAASTALCNLSENESFSFVIMESWLAGRPVIVSSRGSVTSGHCLRSGGGFPVSGADEFRSRVHELSMDERLAAGMGDLGRDYVLKNYSWERVVPKYVEIFENLI